MPRELDQAEVADDRDRQRTLLVGRARVRVEAASRATRRCSTRWPPPATPAPSWATGASCRPTRALRDELSGARLDMLGAFVTIVSWNQGARRDARARRATARLLAAVAGGPPVIVLSDDPDGRSRRARRRRAASRPSKLDRTTVGRRGGASSRSPGRCATRPACAPCSITTAPATSRRRQEIDALMPHTDPALVGLCLDYRPRHLRRRRAARLLARYRDRIWHVHFKDCEPHVAARARREEWDYQTALRHGLFCELGQGIVDFAALLPALARSATTAGSSSSRMCCRRWARRSRAPAEPAVPAGDWDIGSPFCLLSFCLVPTSRVMRRPVQVSAAC